MKSLFFSSDPLKTFSQSTSSPFLLNGKTRTRTAPSLKLDPFLGHKPILRLTHKSSKTNRLTIRAVDVEMVQNEEGIYAARRGRVVILWDLDNKPPRGPPYEAATALKAFAQRFGDVVELSAYANRYAFAHLPDWVREERWERRRIDVLEQKGLVAPAEPYVCGMCGRKWGTNLELKKHFKQLHVREREKKLSRMRSLKGKRREKYREKYISGNSKYNEAARALITPKVGYGLAAELRRAGFYVKTVEDKPQAADLALESEMQKWVSRGVDWLFLVSDDSDFSEMLGRAREASLGTVVVGDRERGLGWCADLWIPWVGVENGEIGEKDLDVERKRRDGFDSVDDELFSRDRGLVLDENGDLYGLAFELVAMRLGIMA